MSAACAAPAETPGDPKPIVEDFTFKSTFDATGPLYARVVYPEGGRDLPIMLVQHGYWGNREMVGYSAERMARRGFFCLCVQTRGWGGQRKKKGKVISETELSAGDHDDGGVETHDLWDALHAAIDKYDKRVDPERVSIVGYSYGGGMAYFASVRFPYLFRGACAFFGIPDYKRHIELRRERLNKEPVHLKRQIGGLPETHPDLFVARSATRAAGNIGRMPFYIVHDEEEPLCPPPMVVEFAEAAKKAGSENVVIHESKVGDKHRWYHGYNMNDNPVKAKNDRLSPMEDRFMTDLLERDATRPKMPQHGELTVIGYLITPKFKCVAGKGDNAAARVKFDFRRDPIRLEFEPLTSKPDAPMAITLSPQALGGAVVVVIDGKPSGRMTPDNMWTIRARIDSTIDLKPVN